MSLLCLASLGGMQLKLILLTNKMTSIQIIKKRLGRSWTKH